MFENSGTFYSVGLYRNNIEVLQRKSIPKAEWVFLSDNLIKTLNADMFIDITFVKYLNLHHNHIKKISASSLMGLKAFNLDVSYNHLESLEDSSIPEVKNVFLNNNKLKSIHSQMFVNILNTNVLDVSYNNITNFNFENSEFDILNISYNKIATISQKSFSEMKILKNLSLSNNLITSIERQSIPKVQNLNLSYNLLKSIEENMFSDKDHLRYLDIRSNCIEHIDFKIIKQVPISFGFFNERCNLNGITETYTFWISKSTVYIIGAVVLVAVFLVMVMIIIYSRRFAKYSTYLKNSETSRVVHYDRVSCAIFRDNKNDYLEPTNDYDEIKNNYSIRESQNEYMDPRSVL
ncbi:PREDICTED: chaoptin-like [Nicrophorus vespilloides]|uniref:Chaoptin-like n=1 Tax=Nicrophorus vespilloides TaxID=110193 RepID=A0ABM1MKI8_NICVS|nr:PREDICTED: chaoptin-like [Nicrophorus vespilloides]